MSRKKYSNHVFNKTFKISKYTSQALARWLSWLEHCPIHQKVADSIPGQGT